MLINENKYSSQQVTGGKRCTHTSFFTQQQNKILQEEKQDQKIREQVSQTLKAIEKNPAMRRKIEDTLTTYKQTLEMQSAEAGMLGSMQAKQRINYMMLEKEKNDN